VGALGGSFLVGGVMIAESGAPHHFAPQSVFSGAQGGRWQAELWSIAAQRVRSAKTANVLREMGGQMQPLASWQKLMV